MPWPAAGFFTGYATQGQLRQALDDLLDRSRSQIGADGVVNATLNASGGVTGTSRGSLRLYGFGAAADTLVSIDTANYADGQVIELRIGDTAQPIEVEHAAAPTAGRIQLAGGINWGLRGLSQRLAIERTGTYWTETERRGSEPDRLVGTGGGNPAFLSDWSAGSGSLAFWKDETGAVRLEGIASKATAVSAASPIFAMPVGYRPSGAKTIVRPTWALNGSTQELHRIVVSPGTGFVQWTPATIATLAAGTVVSFALSYRGEG
jgi:hypothetical protein